MDLGRILDTEQDTADVLVKACSSCDIVITTGGVSMGDRDYVKPALEQHGNVYFGRLNMKPGKPTTFGQVLIDSDSSSQARETLVFSLPGNPVSA